MTYNLRNLGARLPDHQLSVNLLELDGTPTGSGLKYSGVVTSECHAMTAADAEKILEDAFLLGAHVEDNDQEIWFITDGNEIVRVTGGEGPTYYLVDPIFAEDIMEPYVDDDAVLFLKKTGVLPSLAPTP